MTYNLPKEVEKSYCPYEKQPETAYGQYAQADFGEQWMKALHGASHGVSLKAYFFAMSLNYSRYKCVYFSRTPFTTALAVYAQERVFEFFAGIPKKIICDQDKVFLVKENLDNVMLISYLHDLVRKYRATQQEVLDWLERTANGMEYPSYGASLPRSSRQKKYK